MDENSLQFAQAAWMLVGLLVCTAMIALFVRFDRRREADLAKLVHPRFRQRLTEGFSPLLRNVKRGLWLLAVFLLFSAIARPQKGYEWREVKQKGIDILFAVDTSRSMLAQDLTPNRLERARLGIIDFVSRLEGDRVGLIPFAGSAFALCPLTLDYDAFRESLDALDTDLIPRQGTDLASAIKEAERLFDETGNNHRVLVLLTDGEDLQGDVIDAAKVAAEKGMAIYTIGVGSPEGATIPIDLGFGGKDFVRDASGQVVTSTLDESTLKKIAEASNALYVPLGRGAEGLNTIYQEKLRLVPQSEHDQRMERIPLERFEWPLGAAILCLLIEFFIKDRRRPEKARPLPSVARRHKIIPQASAVLAGLVMVTFDVAEASDPRKIYNEGTTAYTEGDFSKASESLRSSLRTQDLGLQQKSYYNLGNSLYRTGQGTLENDAEATIKSWEESIKAYADSLALDSTDQDASFNKAYVEKKLEELKKQQQQQGEKNDNSQKDDQEKKEDQQSKDGEDQKDQESKEGEEEKQGGKESKDGKENKEADNSKDGKDPKEAEKPGESKDGQKGEQSEEEKATQQANEGEQGKEESKEGEPGEMSNERVQKQEMTEEEAKQLLEALRQDQRVVIPIPQQQRQRTLTPDNSTKGKTW